MSACTRSLEFLLESDVDELRGTADTEAGTHVRSCARCRGAARRILASNELLGAALGAVPGDLDVDAVLARARLTVESGPGPELPARRPWRRWAALAAAASIGSLMLLGERDPAPPGVPLAPLSAELPTVDAPADQNVTVIQTDNPDITVLWFFQGE